MRCPVCGAPMEPESASHARGRTPVPVGYCPNCNVVRIEKPTLGKALDALEAQHQEPRHQPRRHLRSVPERERADLR